MIRAIDEGNNDIAKLLIDNGADIDIQDNDRFTALTWAVTKGRDDISRLLREAMDLDYKMASYREGEFIDLNSDCIYKRFVNNLINQLLKGNEYQGCDIRIDDKINTEIEKNNEELLKSNLSKITYFEQIDSFYPIWNGSKNLHGLKYIGDLIQTFMSCKCVVELGLIEVTRILFDSESLSKYYNISTFRDVGDFKEKAEAEEGGEKFEPINPAKSFLERYQECDIIKIINDEEALNLPLALENLNAQILPNNIRTAINDIVKKLGWAVENQDQQTNIDDTFFVTASCEESKEPSDFSHQDGGKIPVQALGDLHIHNEYEANI